MSDLQWLAALLKLAKVAKNLEWQGQVFIAQSDGPYPACPICKSVQSDGHKPTCEFGPAIAEVEERLWKLYERT